MFTILTLPHKIPRLSSSPKHRSPLHLHQIQPSLIPNLSLHHHLRNLNPQSLTPITVAHTHHLHLKIHHQIPPQSRSPHLLFPMHHQPSLLLTWLRRPSLLLLWLRRPSLLFRWLSQPSPLCRHTLQHLSPLISAAQPEVPKLLHFHLSELLHHLRLQRCLWSSLNYRRQSLHHHQTRLRLRLLNLFIP